MCYSVFVVCYLASSTYISVVDVLKIFGTWTPDQLNIKISCGGRICNSQAVINIYIYSINAHIGQQKPNLRT